MRVSALIVCVCLFVCVSALIICKSSESTGECVRVCSSLVACCVFEMYRRTRDLLEPDLLDLETLYKASHFLCLFERQGTENVFVVRGWGYEGDCCSRCSHGVRGFSLQSK